jgi:hypothetical protein
MVQLGWWLGRLGRWNDHRYGLTKTGRGRMRILKSCGGGSTRAEQQGRTTAPNISAEYWCLVWKIG